MDSGIQPVMNVGSGYGCNDGFGFGGSGIWLFAILALMWGGNGFFGRSGVDGRCATVEDLNNSQNFARLENQVQGIGSGMTQGFTNIYNGICDLGYKTQADFSALSKEMAGCCCETNRNIDNVKFDMANYFASVNANTNAGIQKVLDKLCADKTEALQSRISQLELKDALCGVIRYPNNFAYAVGTPFSVGLNNGCCGNGNI